MPSVEKIVANRVRHTKFGLELLDDSLKAFTFFGICFCGFSRSFNVGGAWLVREVF